MSILLLFIPVVTSVQELLSYLKQNNNKTPEFPVDFDSSEVFF